MADTCIVCLGDLNDAKSPSDLGQPSLSTDIEQVSLVLDVQTKGVGLISLPSNVWRSSTILKTARHIGQLLARSTQGLRQLS